MSNRRTSARLLSLLDRNRLNVLNLSEEEAADLLNSVSLSNDNDNDDKENDPDFEPDGITPELDHAIDECLLLDNTYAIFDAVSIADAVNMSLNVTCFSAYVASSTLHEVDVGEDDVPPENVLSEEPSTSAQAALPSTSARRKKRPRSPLPTLDDTCPIPIPMPNNGGFTGKTLESILIDSKEFHPIWKKNSLQLHVNEVAFRGDSSLPAEVKELTTPMQLFCYFFSKEIIDIVVEETNGCVLSKDINTTFSVDADDVYKYIGIHLYMSLYRFQNLESYWGDIPFEPIRQTMSYRRFELIKKFLCFRDEAERSKKGQAGYDPLFRMRIVVNILNDRFDSIPKPARLCVDEQMCDTKMVHHLRQYMPNKPHKWGMKLFVLCDSSGFAYRFKVYNGAGDNKLVDGHPNLGASANVVMRLSQTTPDMANHFVYFDNFYTSLPLLVYLRARGIFSLGTIRVNRVPGCKLSLETAIKDKPRGYSEEYMASSYGVDLTTVLCNKVVRWHRRKLV
ncbi:piggyBac transposable element-derived protein 1-like [Ctenocephalides felis]|uniref:piggyBac transposable element-derived protein 1-like n=1 Tax=Ctenocephalides felis TaxID=7515 RepID=UPI000E6E1245|nr:piggyBac transposable element-derived protein 1-like [Ctenocephalides felis]